jgi:tetratricopeptide (TPR) repeat protein
MTLFERDLAVTSWNALAHRCVGYGLGLQGKLAAAEAHYREALRIRPHWSVVKLNLADVLAAQGNSDEANALYAQAFAATPKLATDPNFTESHFNWGLLLIRLGDFPAARKQLLAATSLQPDYAKAEFNLSLLLAADDDLPAAIEHYQAALRANPKLANTRVDLRSPWLHSLPLADARRHLEQAIRRTPDDTNCQALAQLVNRLYAVAQTPAPKTADRSAQPE